MLFLPMLGDGRPATPSQLEDSMGTVLRRAFRDPSFMMIFAGFFSCGYQLGFITAHFPAMITEMCGPIDLPAFWRALASPPRRRLGRSPSR